MLTDWYYVWQNGLVTTYATWLRLRFCRILVDFLFFRFSACGRTNLLPTQTQKCHHFRRHFFFRRHCQAVVLHQFYLNRHHHRRRIDGHRILMYREKLTAKLEFCTSSGQEEFEADASCLDWRHNASDTRSRFCSINCRLFFFAPLFLWWGGWKWRRWFPRVRREFRIPMYSGFLIPHHTVYRMPCVVNV